MIPIPLIIAGTELLKTALSDDKDENDKVVEEVIGKAVKLSEKPWWKSSRNIATYITIILLMFNRKLGLDLSMEEVMAITGLIGLLIGAKTIKP